MQVESKVINEKCNKWWETMYNTITMNLILCTSSSFQSSKPPSSSFLPFFDLAFSLISSGSSGFSSDSGSASFSAFSPFSTLLIDRRIGFYIVMNRTLHLFSNERLWILFLHYLLCFFGFWGCFFLYFLLLGCFSLSFFSQLKYPTKQWGENKNVSSKRFRLWVNKAMRSS